MSIPELILSSSSALAMSLETIAISTNKNTIRNTIIFIFIHLFGRQNLQNNAIAQVKFMLCKDLQAGDWMFVVAHKQNKFDTNGSKYMCGSFCNVHVTDLYSTGNLYCVNLLLSKTTIEILLFMVSI